MNFLSLGLTAEAPRTNIYWKSAFLKGLVSFTQIFTYRKGYVHQSLLVHG